MKREANVSLKSLNSFGVDVHAAQALWLQTEADLEVLAPGFFKQGRDLVLGGGSNVLLVDDIPGTVFLNRLHGRSLTCRDDGSVLVECAAGENWHELVQWTLQQGFSGLENLSLIPGLAGAAPMQNIGAYGVELADTLESVRAWDWADGQWRTFSNEECHFGYRDSRFKSEQPDRYLITSIRLRLSNDFHPKLDYAGIQEELEMAEIARPTAKDVSNAVVKIRQRKLPDPVVTANAGSFFKNPLLSAKDADALKREFPGLPVWPAGDGLSKLSAGWMIETCGWRGHRQGHVAVADQHALVLVNSGGASGSEILDLANDIVRSVNEKFCIRLQKEPRIVRFRQDPTL
jgi:UDP-N-acetylmuramate dehydrogenase